MAQEECRRILQSVLTPSLLVNLCNSDLLLQTSDLQFGFSEHVDERYQECSKYQRQILLRLSGCSLYSVVETTIQAIFYLLGDSAQICVLRDFQLSCDDFPKECPSSKSH